MSDFNESRSNVDFAAKNAINIFSALPRIIIPRIPKNRR